MRLRLAAVAVAVGLTVGCWQSEAGRKGAERVARLDRAPQQIEPGHGEALEGLDALFERLRKVRAEKRRRAKQRWMEMSKEYQGRYILAVPRAYAIRFDPLATKDEAEAAVDRARARSSAEGWEYFISNLGHLNGDDRREFSGREQRIVEEIAALGEPVVPALIAKTGSEPWAGSWEKEWAKSALAAMGEVAVPELLLALGHKDWLVRESAANVLGETKSKRATEALIETLSDETVGAREAAAAALASIGDARAMRALVRVLKDDVYEIRRAGVQGLAKFGDATCIRALEELREKESPQGKEDPRVLISRAIEAIREREGLTSGAP